MTDEKKRVFKVKVIYDGGIVNEALKTVLEADEWYVQDGMILVVRDRVTWLTVPTEGLYALEVLQEVTA